MYVKHHCLAKENVAAKAEKNGKPFNIKLFSTFTCCVQTK